MDERKERELEEAREEIKKTQEQSQEAVQRMRAERDAKIRKCEEIRAQVTHDKLLTLLHFLDQTGIWLNAALI